MHGDDDRPVAGATHGGADAGDALSPPARHSRFGRNRSMVAAIVVVVVAAVVFVVILSVG